MKIPSGSEEELVRNYLIIGDFPQRIYVSFGKKIALTPNIFVLCRASIKYNERGKCRQVDSTATYAIFHSSKENRVTRNPHIKLNNQCQSF